MGAMPPPPPPSAPEEPPARDWSLLPTDVLASVFASLGAVDVLKGAGLVCSSWLHAAKVPDVWRVVDMENHKMTFKYFDVWRARAKMAVDRSDGQLRVFAAKRFVTEELMQYILERSPSLTTLRLDSCRSDVFGERLAGLVREWPLRGLRSLELDNVDITVGELIVVLDNCPLLEVLTVRDCSGMCEEDEQVLRTKFSRIKTLTFDCADYIIGDYWCCSPDYK